MLPAWRGGKSGGSRVLWAPAGTSQQNGSPSYHWWWVREQGGAAGLRGVWVRVQHTPTGWHPSETAPPLPSPRLLLPMPHQINWAVNSWRDMHWAAARLWLTHGKNSYVKGTTRFPVSQV